MTPAYTHTGKRESAKLRVLDLFSGIGGFSLGLERTGGFETVAFCEIEEFPRRVLGKHWPGVPCYHDIRDLTGERLAADGIAVDVICGGFPCQDISNAGNRAGLAGERSGLWSEYVRLIGELRPRYVIVENVSALLHRGMDAVLGDLSRIRYDAEWENIPAAAVGAPHRRERVWIVAYPAQERAVPCLESIQTLHAKRQFGRSVGRTWVFGVDNPPVCHVDDGLSIGLGGHFAAGNAVVPQIPELIGRAILASLAEHPPCDLDHDPSDRIGDRGGEGAVHHNGGTGA